MLSLEHPETLKSAHEEADLLRTLSRNGEAEQLCRRVWLKRHVVLGPNDPDTIPSKNNRALYLRNVKKPHEALQLDQEILDYKVCVNGNKCLETVHTINNLAMDYYHLRDFENAEKLLQKAVEWRWKRLGTTDERTLLRLSNLGLVYQVKAIYLLPKHCWTRFWLAKPHSTVLLIILQSKLGKTFRCAFKSKVERKKPSAWLNDRCPILGTSLDLLIAEPSPP